MEERIEKEDETREKKRREMERAIQSEIKNFQNERTVEQWEFTRTQSNWYG